MASFKYSFRRLRLGLLLSLCSFSSFAQSKNTIDPTDVLHYTFSLALNDDNDSIDGEATITVVFLQPSTHFTLDLVKKNTGGKGMLVTAVQLGQSSLPFMQQPDKLDITVNNKRGDTASFVVRYTGIPADGLIIDKTKYGHRSFFGDNWPNRAHHWLPCKDVLSDKATVDFIVTAPEHYQVVSNGIQIESNTLPAHLHQTHWSEATAIPVKVMIIGVADFDINYAGNVNSIPVYSWVYPENKEKGFYDYALAADILPYFISNVGPYPYRKLANVQSKTKFGGMENAGAIFYSENSVQGDRKVEALLTHEIAHQWFGNTATETSWEHVWLSEGFATYMTHLYFEHKYGADTLRQRLREDRDKVIAFSKTYHQPVVDTSVKTDFMQLLNANSYQKAGWVLHMLRRQLGDSLFWRGIRSYYAQYAGRNASTEDFQNVMETAGGQDLKAFFRQWLYTPGQPMIHASWKYDKQKKTLQYTVEQLQNIVFNFPLEIEVEKADGKVLYSMQVRDRVTSASFPCSTSPQDVLPDPNTNLLFSQR